MSRFQRELSIARNIRPELKRYQFTVTFSDPDRNIHVDTCVIDAVSPRVAFYKASQHITNDRNGEPVNICLTDVKTLVRNVMADRLVKIGIHTVRVD